MLFSGVCDLYEIICVVVGSEHCIDWVCVWFEAVAGKPILLKCLECNGGLEVSRIEVAVCLFCGTVVWVLCRACVWDVGVLMESIIWWVGFSGLFYGRVIFEEGEVLDEGMCWTFCDRVKLVIVHSFVLLETSQLDLGKLVLGFHGW